MNIRSFIPAALILSSLPLAACSGGDDDTGGGNTPAASKWAGHTYVLTTTSRDWDQPKGLGTDIENVMPHFLFQVSADGKSAKLAVAPKKKDSNGMVTAEIAQDLCSPTYDLPIGGTAPNMSLGPTDVELHLVNDVDATDPVGDTEVTAKVMGLAFTDIFPPNGTAWDNPDDKPGTLAATMDFRELAPLFNQLYKNGVPPTDAEICDQLGDGETACKACADGHVSCLSALAKYIGAENNASVTIQSVDKATRPATCK